MRPRLIGAVLLGLLACGGPSSKGLPAEAAPVVAGCDGLAAGRWDWCAVQALKLAGPLPGAAVLAVCDKLDDSDAIDHCVELAVRGGGVGGDACDRMTRPLLRNSCLLEAADQAMSLGQVGTLDQALQMCERTGPLRLNCHVHIVQGWENQWSMRGVDAMSADIKVLLQASPESAGFQDFGYAVGRVASNVGAGPDYPGPCLLFNDPVDSDACWKGLTGQRLHQGGPDAQVAPPTIR